MISPCRQLLVIAVAAVTHVTCTMGRLLQLCHGVLGWKGTQWDLLCNWCEELVQDTCHVFPVQGEMITYEKPSFTIAVKGPNAPGPGTSFECPL